MSSPIAHRDHFMIWVARIAAVGLLMALCGGTSAWSHQGQESAGALRDPQLLDTGGLSYYAHAHPYLEQSLKHLVRRIPELKGIRPATDPQLLPIILMHTGMRVADFFNNVVDLVAREDIEQEILSSAGEPLARQDLRYDYLILLNGAETPPKYEEYRTDLRGNQAEPDGVEQGYAITTGFSLKSIYFLPALRTDATFRYLGDQMVGAQDLYVVAFAQKPGRATFWGTVSGEWGRVRILDQGIAWIDKATFRIVRLRTDLLAAHPEIGLAQQTTEVDFSEAVIPDAAARLWLPTQASVYAVFQGQAFRNEHRYSNYERFRVSVKMNSASVSQGDAAAGESLH